MDATESTPKPRSLSSIERDRRAVRTLFAIISAAIVSWTAQELFRKFGAFGGNDNGSLFIFVLIVVTANLLGLRSNKVLKANLITAGALLALEVILGLRDRPLPNFWELWPVFVFGLIVPIFNALLLVGGLKLITGLSSSHRVTKLA